MRYCLLILSLMSVVCSAVLRAQPSHAVIFMYHRFGNADYPTTSITLPQFDAQLDYLTEQDFKVWPLDRILQHLQSDIPLPDKVVAITIDDAYSSVYREAFPRLAEHGWPFTLFVSTDAVDNQLPGYMNWEQLREMQQNGASFGNHSASHDHLWKRRQGEGREAWQTRIETDIRHAQSRLEAELGADVNPRPHLFAYPYGEFNSALANMIRGLDYIGLGQESGAVGESSDWRALPRYPMAGTFAALDSFSRKAASLPLTVSSVQPWDPVIGKANPPELTLTLAPGDYVLEQLACYAPGQERIQVSRIGESELSFRIAAHQPLPGGRSRYNCTAPAVDSERWYWYSHPWIIPPGAVSPAD